MPDQLSLKLFPQTTPEEYPVNLEHNEHFNLLVNTGVLLKQQYGGVNVYAPRSDGKATKIILDRLEEICSKFEPLPFASNFQMDPQYNNDQLHALAQSRYQPIVLATAGPGYGKTTVIEGNFHCDSFILNLDLFFH